MKKVLLLAVVAILFFGWSSASLAQCTPGGFIDFVQCFRGSVTQGGVGYVASDVILVMESIGGFLMIIAGVLAGVVIVVSGIMYMGAGSNQTRVGAAKAIFKNGVIGALIIFAAGVIINTIALLALDPFGFFS